MVCPVEILPPTQQATTSTTLALTKYLLNIKASEMIHVSDGFMVLEIKIFCF